MVNKKNKPKKKKSPPPEDTPQVSVVVDYQPTVIPKIEKEKVACNVINVGCSASTEPPTEPPKPTLTSPPLREPIRVSKSPVNESEIRLGPNIKRAPKLMTKAQSLDVPEPQINAEPVQAPKLIRAQSLELETVEENEMSNPVITAAKKKRKKRKGQSNQNSLSDDHSPCNEIKVAPCHSESCATAKPCSNIAATVVKSEPPKEQNAEPMKTGLSKNAKRKQKLAANKLNQQQSDSGIKNNENTPLSPPENLPKPTDGKSAAKNDMSKLNKIKIDEVAIEIVATDVCSNNTLEISRDDLVFNQLEHICQGNAKSENVVVEQLLNEVKQISNVEPIDEISQNIDSKMCVSSDFSIVDIVKNENSELEHIKVTDSCNNTIIHNLEMPIDANSVAADYEHISKNDVHCLNSSPIELMQEAMSIIDSVPLNASPECEMDKNCEMKHSICDNYVILEKPDLTADVPVAAIASDAELDAKLMLDDYKNSCVIIEKEEECGKGNFAITHDYPNNTSLLKKLDTKKIILTKPVYDSFDDDSDEEWGDAFLTDTVLPVVSASSNEQSNKSDIKTPVIDWAAAPIQTDNSEVGPIATKSNAVTETYQEKGISDAQVKETVSSLKDSCKPVESLNSEVSKKMNVSEKISDEKKKISESMIDNKKQLDQMKTAEECEIVHQEKLSENQSAMTKESNVKTLPKKEDVLVIYTKVETNQVCEEVTDQEKIISESMLDCQKQIDQVKAAEKYEMMHHEKFPEIQNHAHKEENDNVLPKKEDNVKDSNIELIVAQEDKKCLSSPDLDVKVTLDKSISESLVEEQKQLEQIKMAEKCELSHQEKMNCETSAKKSDEEVKPILKESCVQNETISKSMMDHQKQLEQVKTAESYESAFQEKKADNQTLLENDKNLGLCTVTEDLVAKSANAELSALFTHTDDFKTQQNIAKSQRRKQKKSERNSERYSGTSNDVNDRGCQTTPIKTNVILTPLTKSYSEVLSTPVLIKENVESQTDNEEENQIHKQLQEDILKEQCRSFELESAMNLSEAEIMDLKSKYSLLQDEMEKFKLKNDSLEAQIIIVKNELNLQSKTCADHTWRNSELEKCLSEFTVKNADLVNTVNEMNIENCQKASLIDRHVFKITEMKSTISEYEESQTSLQHLTKEMQSSLEEKDEKIGEMETDLLTAGEQMSKLVLKIQEVTNESLKMISLSLYEDEVSKLTKRAKEAEDRAIQMHNELVNMRKIQETESVIKDFSHVTQEFARANIENPPSPIEPLNVSTACSIPLTGFESDWSSSGSMVSASALTPNTSFTESTETSTSSTPELISPTITVAPSSIDNDNKGINSKIPTAKNEPTSGATRKNNSVPNKEVKRDNKKKKKRH